MSDLSVDLPGHVDVPARAGSGGAHRRDDRAQPDALLDMLGHLDNARGEAVRRGDTAAERTALAARVACWTALAELADTVHPVYGSACRRAALSEWTAMAALPAPRHRRTRSAASVGRPPLPRRRRSPDGDLPRHRAAVPAPADGPRHAQPEWVSEPAA